MTNDVNRIEGIKYRSKIYSAVAVAAFIFMHLAAVVADPTILFSLIAVGEAVLFGVMFGVSAALAVESFDGMMTEFFGKSFYRNRSDSGDPE